MLILMAYTMNNNNQYQQKCLIGNGIILNQLNNYYKL